MTKLTRNYDDVPPRAVPDDLPAEAVKTEFAKRLNRALTAKGWNQSELGRRAGMGRDSISNYIAGKNLPSPVKLAALAGALGVGERDLLPTRGIRNATERISALDVRDLGDGSVWLRVNQRIEWNAALKIMQILKGEDGK